MPIGNQLYLNNDLEVLNALLIENTEVIYRKKQQGYGLNITRFDSIKGCSKKKFLQRRDEFLRKWFIVKLLSNKKNSQYFMITPLGIRELFLRSDKIDENQIKRAFSLFSVFFDKQIKEAETKKIGGKTITSYRESYNKWFGSDLEYIGKTISVLGVDVITELIRKACEAVEILDYHESFQVSIVYTINNFCKVTTRIFEVKQDEILMKYLEDSQLSYSRQEKITQVQFFQILSEHITNIFYFSLFIRWFEKMEEISRESFSGMMKNKLEYLEAERKRLDEIESIFDKKILRRFLTFNGVSLTRILFINTNYLDTIEQRIEQLSRRLVTTR